MLIAVEKYLKTETIIMGMCGDVERGLIIGMEEVFYHENFKMRCVRFKTTNEEYPTIFFTEKQILSK